VLRRVKPSPGVNFIIRAAFTRKDPKSAIETVKLSVFFELLGSASAKAVCRMLMKLIPDSPRYEQKTERVFELQAPKPELH